MSVRSAARVLDLIEWMASRAVPVALAEACHALNLPKSSTLLLLKTLVDYGYAERGEDGRYRLLRLPGEGSAEKPAWGTILRVADPILREAVAEVGESGFVAVMTDTFRIRYLNKILPAREIRYDRDISKDRVPHHVASGIALLSALPDESVDRYLTTLGASTDERDQPQAVRASIAKARADRVAINRHGRIEGASGVAAPLLDAMGRPVAAINLSGPTDRFLGNLDAIARVIRQTANRVNQELARRIAVTNQKRKETP